VLEMKLSVKKIIAGIAAAVILLLLIAFAAYLKSVVDYKHAVSAISIQEIPISDIADGIYVGECDVNFIYARVEVAVHNGAITDIRILEHKNDRGQAAETVVDEIVSEQRVDVDTVSGATNSSIVLKKAVENALKNGM